ncbi:unnamed protein product [Rangifer tarandus platyrhynchus]|uniref:Uncharacterized protein n=1 Tax=Rangifer tarandus platyrhynchus TaxID=3082113 RepID=A0ABN8Z558_RANTA|nr:unnamed protein product [Rangifer tarandus platyrhynchus]
MQKVKPDVPSSSCFTSTQGLGGGGSKNARARDGRRPGIGFLLGMDYQMQENLVGMDVRKQSFAAGIEPAPLHWKAKSQLLEHQGGPSCSPSYSPTVLGFLAGTWVTHGLDLEKEALLGDSPACLRSPCGYVRAHDKTAGVSSQSRPVAPKGIASDKSTVTEGRCVAP